MNTKAKQFWRDFCRTHHMEKAECREAFQFGASADWLARLVDEGKKTATTSGYVFYELEEEALPEAGEFSIVLNSRDEPVAVIQTQSVEVVPFNEVPEDFALAEGEGDFQYWREVHIKLFTESLQRCNRKFSPDMLVVCERFKKVFPK